MQILQAGLDEKASSPDVKSLSASANDPSSDDTHMNEPGLDENASSADVKSLSASANGPSASDSHRSRNRWPHF